MKSYTPSYIRCLSFGAMQAMKPADDESEYPLGFNAALQFEPPSFLDRQMV